MAITLKWRTINLKPKNIMAQPKVQTTVAPLPTAQPQAPVASQPYTPWTSIDGRPVQTNTGNPYIAYSQRAKPTVATAQQPVISKTTNNSLIYDPNDPEDYLMKLQARGVTGKTPTEQEYYQALQAQKALQARQTNSANPLQSQMDELIRQQQEQRGLESGRDTNELDAYRKQLDQQYGVQRDELLASWDRQRSAAQNVYSFSWFGRSTAAANKMTEIQKWIDWSISSLNAAKEAAIAAKKAELEWADSETLSALNSRVQQYQDAANKRQMDSLQQTAQANQTSGASYIESLNNLMATASKNGMDIWNPEDIQIYAQMARNPDGSINEEFVGALPEWMQAIIRTANIQQSKEAPKIENFWTTKSPRYMQRDGAKRAPVSWAGGWAMWGGWSGWVRSGGWASWGWMWGAWVVVPSSQATDILNDPNLSKSVWWRSVLWNVPWTPQYDFQKKVDNYINNLVLPKIKNLKGSTSDKDIAFIKAAATSLDTGMSESAFKKTLQDMWWVLNKYDASGNPLWWSKGSETPVVAAQQKPKSTTRWWYKAR